MTPTRIEGFIVGAAGNMDTIDALHAISSQMEVAHIALYAIGRAHGLNKEIDFTALVTFLGDLHETIGSLMDHMQHVETLQPLHEAATALRTGADEQLVASALAKHIRALHSIETKKSA